MRSNAWWTAWLCLALFTWGCGGLRSGLRSMEDPVDVEVHGVVSPTPRLEISLVNRSDQVLTVAGLYLPWNFWMEFVLVSTADQSPLMMAPPLCMFTTQQVVMRPGERITGTIHLDCEVAGIRDALAKGDVVVNWSYTFRADEMAHDAPPVHGSVVLRATDLRNAPPTNCRDPDGSE